MRVTTGQAKGQVLRVPKSPSLRPTTGLVKSALFSILESMAADWSSVLDLYAGTGALGIEALSRGADWADFVEREPRCCATIKLNLQKTGLGGKAKVYCASVESTLPMLNKQYSIIFMDPPYASQAVGTVLGRLDTSAIVGGETVIAALHSSRLSLMASYGRLALAKQRRHGDTCISLYQEAKN